MMVTLPPMLLATYTRTVPASSGAASPTTSSVFIRARIANAGAVIRSRLRYQPGMGGHTEQRKWLGRLWQVAALLAACALLTVTTVSVLPAHQHPNETSRVCDICNSGHLPCLQ